MEKEQSSILKPNNDLIGLKKSKKEEAKIPKPTGWRLLVLPFKMKEKTKGGVILAEDTLERQQIASQVGLGIFASSFFDFFTPISLLFGVNIDDCSFSILLLIF